MIQKRHLMLSSRTRHAAFMSNRGDSGKRRGTCRIKATQNPHCEFPGAHCLFLQGLVIQMALYPPQTWLITQLRALSLNWMQKKINISLTVTDSSASSFSFHSSLLICRHASIADLSLVSLLSLLFMPQRIKLQLIRMQLDIALMNKWTVAQRRLGGATVAFRISHHISN